MLRDTHSIRDEISTGGDMMSHVKTAAGGDSPVPSQLLQQSKPKTESVCATGISA
jgi:hypothetical protein